MIVKDDQSTPWACDCRESSQGRPCETALAVYRHGLEAGRVRRDEVPGCLHALGLVVDDGESAEFLSLIPPGAAALTALGPVEEEIAERHSRLRSLRSALAVFEGLYDDKHRLDPPVLTRIVGLSVINAAIDTAVADCRDEILTIQPGGARPAVALADGLARSRDLLARGVRQRTIYQHTVRSHGPTLSYIEEVTAAGAEVRTIADVFDRMLIFDREVAFIPSDEVSTASTAVRVQHPALIRFLLNHFNSSWARAVPVRPAVGSPRTPVITSDLQRTILLAVVNGETDASIARRIGMSRRSVAEHMRKVSEQLGSNSRAQLGFLLATSGLLEAPLDGTDDSPLDSA